jgi:hypothetical protein
VRPEGAACGCGCGWGDVSTVHRRYTPDGAYRIAYLTALMSGTSYFWKLLLMKILMLSPENAIKLTSFEMIE